MSYLPDPKDPAEIVPIGFNFAAITDTPSNPTVEITVRWGDEAAPTLQKVGSPWVDGAIVYQRFLGGAHLNDYNLKCLASTPSNDRFAVDCVLAVRNRPV